MQYIHTVTTTKQLKINYTNSLKYILSASYRSDTDQGAGDSTMSKTKSLPPGSLQIDLHTPAQTEDRESKL